MSVAMMLRWLVEKEAAKMGTRLKAKKIRLRSRKPQIRGVHLTVNK